MPFFHATRASYLESIFKHGLGGIDLGPQSEECERGVYLATDPRLSLAVMLIHLMNNLDDVQHIAPTPRDELATWRIIVVDDARMDPRKLRPDPQVRAWKGSWLYDGVIDVTGAVILTADQVQAADAAGSLSEPSDEGWEPIK